MKNVIIIHGCPTDEEKVMDADTRTYDKHWMPWLKAQLTALNIKVETPLMPNPWEPVYEDFKAEFEKYPVDEDSILIGHSCGTTFLTRWLGETKQKVDKLILISPWYITDKDDDARREFYEQPIDESIKERTNEIIIFTSNNDYEDGKKSVKIFESIVGGKVIELKDRGHYTMRDMGTMEFPELLAEVTKN